jgi:hypothetical protein
VWWIPQEIKIGRDTFQVDANKLSEPAYGRSLNSMPVNPRVIFPGASSELTRLPSFIVMDVDRKIKKVSGYFIISGVDLARAAYTTRQQFWMSTSCRAEKPTVHVTFGDVEATGPGDSQTYASDTEASSNISTTTFRRKMLRPIR